MKIIIINGSPRKQGATASILHTMEQLLYNKYALGVITGENYGSRDAARILTKQLKYSGASVCGKIVYKLPFDADPCSDAFLKKKMDIAADRIYKSIVKKKPYCFQAAWHKAIFRIGIKPFVLKKGAAYQGVLQKWKKYQVM